MNIDSLKYHLENNDLDNSYEDIGRKIEECRNINKYSCEKVAEEIGCADKTIYNFETGENLNSDIFLAIMYFFGLRLWSEYYPEKYLENFYDIGEFIKEVRKAQNLSQDKVAKEAGTTQRTMLRLEDGRNIRSWTLFGILKALKIEWKP